MITEKDIRIQIEELMKKGNYKAALHLSHYTNDRRILSQKILSLTFEDIKRKTIIEFGSYKGETLRWRVLDKRTRQMLLVSEKAIDWKPYNEKNGDITWEECTLRAWLNNEFMKEAFIEEEQSGIAETVFKNPDIPVRKTKGRYDTKDRIFLLGMEEVNQYLKIDKDRICKATAYAVKQNGNNNGGGCWWWLRSPGCRSNYAANVSSSGRVNEYGDYVSVDFAVRPAFWLNL